MNRDLSDLPGEGEQRDPVADFFARERADIRDLPAGTDRWESIVTEAQRPVRHHWFPYLAGAAAVVVVGGVIWGTGHGPGTDQAADPASSTASVATVTTTATGTPSAQPTATDSPSSAPSTVATTGPFLTPTSFDLVSMTNAGGKHVYALGSASCPKGECTVVIGSDDDGASWTTHASLTSLTSPGPRATPAGPDQVVGIRFANPEVGFVYGSTTMRTVDGGRSWRPMDVGGRTVLSVETDGSTVWMVTAAKCQRADAAGARGCSGLDVRSLDVTSSAPQQTEALDLPEPVESAWLSMDGADAYVSVSYLDPSTHTPPRRVSGKPVTLARPGGCQELGGLWVWGTANRKGGLVAVCQIGDANGSYGVATSSDRGATWSEARIARGLGPTQPTGVWLTAVDLDRLVAVSQGLPTSALKSTAVPTLVTSGDGGATWTRPKAAPSGVPDWVGAAGGGLVYAVSGGRSYWVSHDSGTTFEEVPLRR
ncbi:hypothetical protein SAMN04489867_0780 [Pedococcus dokdonensis]|uniref:BNR repeat-like domain-containing protein n=1 Tax=Pedococcus dokdonensis TaxID=443156 RepID=A0A1H0N125_9MICO|nr:sialidase family protein [Pedococcus dokdonensis]SDO86225.1 hypothetical protein SAMN04489867_0780 [Pedococcus dokdonensis]